jgi:hypothetical protein
MIDPKTDELYNILLSIFLGIYITIMIYVLINSTQVVEIIKNTNKN